MLLCPGKTSPAALIRGIDDDWSYCHAECGFKAVFCIFSVWKLSYLFLEYRFFQLRVNKYTGLGIWKN